MNLIIAGVGTQPCLFNCIKAARARSGCDVIVVNTVKQVSKDSIQCKFSDMDRIPDKVIDWNLLFQVRWCMLLWTIKTLRLKGPFYCPDWDIMIFHDVTDHINALSGFDMLYTMDNGHCGSGAHVVKNVDVLENYVDYVVQHAKAATEPWQLSDMYCWHMFCRERKMPIANLSEELSGGVFDHNIHTGGDVFEVDEQGRKRIEWHSLRPYFVRRFDGKRIKAEAIHCWQTYKHKTGELLQHAGMS